MKKLPQLTKVDDSILMKIEKESDNEFYQKSPREVFLIFKSKYPDYKMKNVLQMRAVLAKDVEIVKSGRTKFVLILTSELDKLDRRNEIIRQQNKKVRAYNKAIRNRQRFDAEQFISDLIGKDIFSKYLR